ncbi:hypothetical protein EYC80_002568 [Monilinia laxa]|uniref:Uncharacterized protein n=1 Tax=Monilinia laxa TaxID=61186 RepID=A0A5N6K4B0_MONLA|nr:hypothetical protein EYC80_002568 [Monilinia laxa]
MAKCPQLSSPGKKKVTTGRILSTLQLSSLSFLPISSSLPSTYSRVISLKSKGPNPFKTSYFHYLYPKSTNSHLYFTPLFNLPTYLPTYLVL